MAGINHNILRQITFGRRFDWEIKLSARPGGDSLFPGLSSSLYQGITGIDGDTTSIVLPAQTVEYPRASVQSMEFEELRLKFPEGVQPRIMNVTFFDNSDYSLMKFFEQWMSQEITRGNDFRVAYLEDVVREIQVNKFGPVKGGSRAIVDSRRYVVYPEGELPESLDSSASDAYTFAIQFVIVGQSPGSG